MRSGKIHELSKGYKGIVINIALLDCILRSVVIVLGKGRYNFPIRIWKIVMTEHAAVYMPSLPMI